MNEYLKQQLGESFAVVDTCLACIYRGDLHMYRPLAGQLRLLLCDTQRMADNSLIRRAYPNLKVSAIAQIEWSAEKSGEVHLDKTEAAINRIAQMPFEISAYENGLVIADVLVDKERMLPIQEWGEQRLSFDPVRLSIRRVIREVADKGGGAHVDSSASAELRLMYQRTPHGATYAELFVIAIGRFVQRIGEHLFKYQGCRVPENITSAQHEKYRLLVAAHQMDVAEP
ncbi:hypothetical protein E4L96_06395 [Massilia arenosa]|uniref:Uncharacterized protein n=1 Tax=Zemynaea arenosa TaxID=2561931 RepID=A0A4Y9SL66_9BURK|nr:hypothetical protein [Massilia arenosa]TFW23902.1 hypothetical protein E4L96_06395 [Massilia arenosa]